MKYKKILPVIFILTLFASQQVQASANIFPNENLSKNNLIQSNGIPSQIYVNMLHLDLDNGGIVAQPRAKCEYLEVADGCGEGGAPYLEENPMLVDVENDYLLDVLPREMNVAENNPTLEALQAQALAARSILAWKTKYIPDPEATNGYINNSIAYQVFIPYAYENYTPNDSIRQRISDAVQTTNGQYLSYNGEFIDAEFGSDMKDRTITEPATPPKDYLKGVEEPISTTCGAVTNSNGYGMSQLGAYRWSLGNQCATGDGAAWPVKWEDYRQILVHYYTGIDILNANGNKVAPDDRWNLLNHNIPHQMNSEQSFNAVLSLQNTSTWDWTSNAIIGWQFTQNGLPPDPQQWQGISSLNVAKGAAFDGTMSIIAPPTGGDYVLHLNVGHLGGTWFSDTGWPDATIDIHVNGPTATPTFTPTFTPIPVTSTPTLITGVLTCNTVVAGVTCTNYGSYLDYNINIIRTGLTGGATAGGITIGTYKRSTNGGNMGMKSDFVHSETSGYAQNTVYSRVVIQPFDAAAVGYAGFSSGGAGTNVSVTNKVLDWRYIGGSGGWPNTLSVGGDVNWPITGYSIVGHIYLYSNQNFITVTPTSTPTAQPTVTPKPCNCTVDLLSLGDLYCSIFGSSSKLAVPIPIKLLQSTQQAILDVQLFHRVEDEILSQTPQGQHYINLYYGHGTEIVGLLRGNSDLKAEAIATLQLWEPSLQALVDGQGSNVIITSGQVQTVQTFLDHLYALGSPELRQTIESERTLNPLEQNIGRTIDQASVSLVDYQVPSSIITPTTTSTPSPTETSTATQTATVTPTVTIPDTPTNTPTEAPTDAATATFSPLPTETPTSSETPTFSPTYTSTPTVTPAPITLAFYLHGNGATANPPTLFLDSTAPTGTTAKYKDSTSVNFNAGNSWKEVGDWIAAPIQISGQLTTLNNLQVWLGLKNSDDQGTNFDLRVEVYENNTLLGSAESLCITGITRNPNLAKQVILPFETLLPAGFNGTTDVFSLKIKTRIGTNGTGGMCGGHSNAVGLRLYFDASNRPAGFDSVFAP